MFAWSMMSAAIESCHGVPEPRRAGVGHGAASRPQIAGGVLRTEFTTRNTLTKDAQILMRWSTTIPRTQGRVALSMHR